MVAVAKRKQKGPPSGFGVRLRELRIAAKMTQQELGERLGLRLEAVSRYERGMAEPAWPVVVQFAAALGVRPNDFLVEPGGPS